MLASAARRTAARMSRRSSVDRQADYQRHQADADDLFAATRQEYRHSDVDLPGWRVRLLALACRATGVPSSCEWRGIASDSEGVGEHKVTHTFPTAARLQPGVAASAATPGSEAS
jgi:hypothetical protein